MHPEVFFFLVGEAVNPVCGIEVVGSTQAWINNFVGVADAVVVTLVGEVVASHVGELFGLHVHCNVLLSHEVVEAVVGFFEEPVLVAAFANRTNIHNFFVTLDDVVFFVVEECVHLGVPIFLGGESGFAFLGVAWIFVVGCGVVLAVRILAEEEVEMALNVVLSSFFGDLASHGFVTLPVFGFGFDEIEFFHCEDWVVALSCV